MNKIDEKKNLGIYLNTVNSNSRIYNKITYDDKCKSYVGYDT